ncbi:MAG: hypothetical protein A4E65_00249 [Syntrophorhabdus sp. PtaU1.Bin153]|nr:MAG: hypothetical protein A4E65_00249 [Syntrophorhabdus sp. PtaU1.Bin153]
MNKCLVIAVLSLLLVSCFTPPGKLKDTDFVSKQVSLNTSVPESVANMLDGFRYCGPESGGLIFVTHHGTPNCLPPKSDGSVVCDIYAGSNVSGGPVLGRVDLSPAPTGTIGVLRIQTWIGNKDKILTSWEMFLRAKAKEVCPDE